MLFTLTTLKNLEKGSGAASNKMLKRKHFLCSQSLMVADGALKLDYARVMFVDPGV